MCSHIPGGSGADIQPRDGGGATCIWDAASNDILPEMYK